MTEEEMFAHKLVDMYEGGCKNGRDVLEVHAFLKKGVEINKTIVEDRSGMSYKEALGKCVEMLEKSDGDAGLRDETVFLLKAEMDLMMPETLYRL